MCIVVVNYAASTLLQGALDAAEVSNSEVVVVDNYSTSAERIAIRELVAAQGWSLVEMPDNRGFGPGVNAGFTYGRSLGHDTFLLLNPDVVVTAEVIEALRQTILDDPHSLASPILVDLEGRVVFAGSTLDLTDGRIRGRSSYATSSDTRLRWLTAACLAVHAELWEQVGGFGEDYFMYWEDVDFGYRCAQLGARLNLREDLRAVHDQGGTQGPRRGRAKSDLYYYFNIRNRMQFAVSQLDRRRVRQWLTRTPMISWEILLQGGRRQLIESPRVMWSAARGMLAAFRLGLQALRTRATAARGR